MESHQTDPRHVLLVFCMLIGRYVSTFNIYIINEDQKSVISFEENKKHASEVQKTYL